MARARGLWAVTRCSLLVAIGPTSTQSCCTTRAFTARSASSIKGLVSSLGLTSTKHSIIMEPHMQSPLERFLPSVEGIILDLDGTLTKPHAIDFNRIKERIGMPLDGGSILHWISAQPSKSEVERESMLEIVREEEALGLTRMELNNGYLELHKHLLARGKSIRAAIATRNGPDALEKFCDVVVQQGLQDPREIFDVMLARDAHSEALGRPIANKPSEEVAHEVLRRWGWQDNVPLVQQHHLEAPLDPLHKVVFVGDNLDDCAAGRRAGMRSVFITNGEEQLEGSYPHRALSNSERMQGICAVVSDLIGVVELLGGPSPKDNRPVDAV